MRNGWRIVFLVFAAALLLGTATRAAESPIRYSVKPVRKPVRDVAENLVEFTMFNNWLNENFESTPPDRRQALKEHLYSIIDSHVKQLRKREGVMFPREKDLVLSQAFVWASHMGVFGAETILMRLDPAMANGITSHASPPESFELTLNGEYLVLTSSLGDWTVAFPYHFMVGDLREYEAKNGLETQLAIISTGFGHHAADDGYSQATIMIAY